MAKGALVGGKATATPERDCDQILNNTIWQSTERLSSTTDELNRYSKGANPSLRIQCAKIELRRQKSISTKSKKNLISSNAAEAIAEMASLYNR
jgi:hypothetical protein